MLRTNLFGVAFNADVDNGAGASPVAQDAPVAQSRVRKARKPKGSKPVASMGNGNANQRLFAWLAKQKGATGRACSQALGVTGIPNALKHWVVAGYASRTNARPTMYSVTAKGRAALKSGKGLVGAVPATNPKANGGVGYTITGQKYTVQYNGSGAKGRAAWGKPKARKPKVRKPKVVAAPVAPSAVAS